MHFMKRNAGMLALLLCLVLLAVAACWLVLAGGWQKEPEGTLVRAAWQREAFSPQMQQAPPWNMQREALS